MNGKNSLQVGTVERISRSDIDLEDFNPRTITPENRERLKRSLVKFGFVGLPVFNRRTRHIVGGHQRVGALDSINRSKDYELDCLCVDLSEKDEAALNIALNNTDAQGEYNFVAVQGLCKDFGIDPVKDCLFSPELASIEFPDFASALDGFASVPKKEVSAEEQEHFREERERMRSRMRGEHAQTGSYKEEQKGTITLVFKDEAQKQRFLRTYGYPEDKSVFSFQEFLGLEEFE